MCVVNLAESSYQFGVGPLEREIEMAFEASQKNDSFNPNIYKRGSLSTQYVLFPLYIPLSVCLVSTSYTVGMSYSHCISHCPCVRLVLESANADPAMVPNSALLPNPACA